MVRVLRNRKGVWMSIVMMIIIVSMGTVGAIFDNVVGFGSVAAETEAQQEAVEQMLTLDELEIFYTGLMRLATMDAIEYLGHDMGSFCPHSVDLAELELQR